MADAVVSPAPTLEPTTPLGTNGPQRSDAARGAPRGRGRGVPRSLSHRGSLAQGSSGKSSIPMRSPPPRPDSRASTSSIGSAKSKNTPTDGRSPRNSVTSRPNILSRSSSAFSNRSDLPEGRTKSPVSSNPVRSRSSLGSDKGKDKAAPSADRGGRGAADHGRGRGTIQRGTRGARGTDADGRRGAPQGGRGRPSLASSTARPGADEKAASPTPDPFAALLESSAISADSEASEFIEAETPPFPSPSVIEYADSLDQNQADDEDLTRAAEEINRAVASLADDSLPSTPFALEESERPSPLDTAVTANGPSAEAPLRPASTTTDDPQRPRPEPLPLADSAAGSLASLDAIMHATDVSDASLEDGDDSLLEVEPPPSLLRATSSFDESLSGVYADSTADTMLPRFSPPPALPTSPIQPRPDPIPHLRASSPESDRPRPISEFIDPSVPTPHYEDAASSGIEDASMDDREGQWGQLAELSLSAWGVRRRGSSAGNSLQMPPSVEQGPRVRSGSAVSSMSGRSARAGSEAPEPAATVEDLAAEEVSDDRPSQAPASYPSVGPAHNTATDSLAAREPTPAHEAPSEPLKSAKEGKSALPSGSEVEAARPTFASTAWPPSPYGLANVPSQWSQPPRSSLANEGERFSVDDYIARLRAEIQAGARDPPPHDINDDSAQGVQDPKRGGRGDDDDSDDEDDERKMRQQQAKPPSLTLSVWRGGGDLRTRLSALGAVVAINFFLPFINGVMLGASRSACGFLPN